MQNIDLVKDLKNRVGESVTLKGWVVTFRSSGGVVFIQLRDGSGEVQCVVSRDKVPESVFALAESLTVESSIVLNGVVQEDPRSPSGVEISVQTLEVIQRVVEEYPIGKKEHGPDFLLSHRHLWLRSPKQWAIQRVRHQLIMGIFEYFDGLGFTKIDSPILTPSSCEGTSDLFPVDYVDGSKVYLSQSGQLYLEAAIMSLGKVFDFGPVFRAEKSKTRRHLTEFWMMDAEMAFVEHEENIELQENLVVYLVARVLELCTKEFEILERDTKPLGKIKAPFVHLTYEETLSKLQELGSKIEKGSDLGNEDETLLTQAYEQPVVIEKYPAEVKAFYMKRDSENPSLALCNDLLAPEGYGEIIGGSQREDDFELLKTRLIEHHLKEEDFLWYLDLRKFGSVPHSGFGLGLERLVAWICGVGHVRETIPFPRTINRVYP